METVLVCTVFGVFLCFAFYLGIKIGKVLPSSEQLEFPITSRKKEVKPTKEEQAELDKWRTIMENIENYDGTAQSQKEV